MRAANARARDGGADARSELSRRAVRLYAFLADDGPAIGLLTDHDRVIRLRTVDGGLDLALAEDRLTQLLAEASDLAASGNAADAATGIPTADLEPLPAIEFPGKIVCVGLNYADHVSEGGRSAPQRPILNSSSMIPCLTARRSTWICRYCLASRPRCCAT